jgi:hypothetical protein
VQDAHRAELTLFLTGCAKNAIFCGLTGGAENAIVLLLLLMAPPLLLQHQLMAQYEPDLAAALSTGTVCGTAHANNGKPNGYDIDAQPQ